jgi:multidrug efflux system outer membrane protein
MNRRLAKGHRARPAGEGTFATAARLQASGLLVLWLLSGCTLVGPDYKSPQPQVSNTFASADGLPFVRDSIDSRWWRRFRDPMLERLIEQALAKNHDLRIALARLREARALWLEARFDRYPTVTAGGSYANVKQSVAALSDFPDLDTDHELYRAGFDAFWEIDFFGRVRRSVEARAAEDAAQKASLHDVMISLIAEVARNFLELRGAQNRLAVAQRNAENQRQTLDLTTALQEGGRGTALDTARARAQLDATRSGIPPLQASVRRAIHRLSVLTGAEPQALAPALSAPAPLPGLPARIALGSARDLLRRRPDIRVAERNLAAATARIGVATADLFPRVTFTGSIALEANSPAGFGKSGGDAYSFGPSIRWAAFDIGRVRAQIAGADARAEAALAQYEKAVLTALEETENTLTQFRREAERRDLLRSSSQASKEAAYLARARFEEGAADFLTVLDAERTLLEAEERLAQSQTDTATALVALYKALGGGWEEATSSPAWARNQAPHPSD